MKKNIKIKSILTVCMVLFISIILMSDFAAAEEESCTHSSTSSITSYSIWYSISQSQHARTRTIITSCAVPGGCGGWLSQTVTPNFNPTAHSFGSWSYGPHQGNNTHVMSRTCTVNACFYTAQSSYNCSGGHCPM